MARKKVKLAWIPNDATRRATFKKRKKGLMKKVSELATLCGVEACLVVYGPHDAADAEPEVWPSPEEAARVATRLRSMPDMDQWRKMINQEGFLRLRAAKLQDQLRRQERENRELEVNLFAHEIMAGGRSLDDIGLNDAVVLAQMIDMKLKLVQNRLGKETVRMLPFPAAEPVPLEILPRKNWFVEEDIKPLTSGGSSINPWMVGEEVMPLSYVETIKQPWLELEPEGIAPLSYVEPNFNPWMMDPNGLFMN
ncbi:agamous-like MADS-box protein AGL80 [Zingiber officinale]|uniref:MADS-box domain-containing protein n=1 Tax=Zingiber officinale TaxID=94328 RepID=A0A8J5IHL0_ZINOF|nr:agamous-like MADS-box protein AGL80 [Zingiber officinale]KAG6535235.1 hypothetical protein ZIOFF_000200 [Zingiber officinale]